MSPECFLLDQISRYLIETLRGEKVHIHGPFAREAAAGGIFTSEEQRIGCAIVAQSFDIVSPGQRRCDHIIFHAAAVIALAKIIQTAVAGNQVNVFSNGSNSFEILVHGCPSETEARKCTAGQRIDAVDHPLFVVMREQVSLIGDSEAGNFFQLAGKFDLSVSVGAEVKNRDGFLCARTAGEQQQGEKQDQ